MDTVDPTGFCGLVKDAFRDAYDATSAHNHVIDYDDRLKAPLACACEISRTARVANYVGGFRRSKTSGSSGVSATRTSGQHGPSKASGGDALTFVPTSKTCGFDGIPATRTKASSASKTSGFDGTSATRTKDSDQGRSQPSSTSDGP